MPDETTQQLARGLPAYYPISEESNNYKLMRGPASQADALSQDIEDATLTLDFDKVQTQSLTVGPDERYTVESDSREYYNDVTVKGTLVVEGALFTSDLEVTDEGQSYNLEVPAGETYTVPYGDVENYQEVLVKGDLVLNGDIETQKLIVKSAGTVSPEDGAIRVQDAVSQNEDLRVKAGESYTVVKDDTDYYEVVTVEGDLSVEGTLRARRLQVKDNGTVTQEDTGKISLGGSFFYGSGAEVVNNGKIELEPFSPDKNTYIRGLGELVGVTPRDGETVDHYRARVFAEFALSTSEGTVDDVLDTMATILNISPSKIDIDDRSAPGRATVKIPSAPLDKQSLTKAEVAEIVERLLPASYVLDTLVSGTFTYITPATYNVDDHNPDRGYDGLDANGDPEDTGGTYAGLIT